MKIQIRRGWLFMGPLVACVSCIGSTTSNVAGPAAQDENGDHAAEAADSSGMTAAATNPAPEGKVTVLGKAPASAEAKTATAKLFDATGGLIASANAKVSGGAFTLEFGGDAAVSTGGNVAVFVDMNGDTVCNIAPTDIGGLAAAQNVVTMTLDSNAQPPCSAFGEFSFTVNGNDFAPHNGETIYAALLDTKTKAYVTEPRGIKVQNAAWSLTFPGALSAGRSYQLQYFADLLANGKCQNHSWVADVPVVTKDTTILVSHDTSQTPVCTTFPAFTPNP